MQEGKSIYTSGIGPTPGKSVRPVKALGQHFLIDKEIIARVIEVANLSKDDAVLEIGPGTGNLTGRIARASRLVVAVEKDRRMAEILKKSLGSYDNIIILMQDIFDVDFSTLSDISNEFKIVANIPYNISSQLLTHFLEPLGSNTGSPLRISEMVLLVQKEVAMRLVSPPGKKEYGILTVATGLFSTCEILFDVPPECFHPRPKIISSVIRIRPYDMPRYELLDRRYFFTTVKAAFSQRRKTILNALSGSGYFKDDKETLSKALHESGVDGKLRGEALSILQFVDLANSFFRLGLLSN